MKPIWKLENQYQNTNGSNLVNGKVYVYFQGRSELAPIYLDSNGITSQTNPVILDVNARGIAFGETDKYVYTVRVCNFYNQEIFHFDTVLDNGSR